MDGNGHDMKYEGFIFGIILIFIINRLAGERSCLMLLVKCQTEGKLYRATSTWRIIPLSKWVIYNRGDRKSPK